MRRMVKSIMVGVVAFMAIGCSIPHPMTVNSICATDVRNGQTLLVDLNNYQIVPAECVAGEKAHG